ncbi:FliH/SctL family protein [Novosphingobium sp.]|uniref:FliH/SctL family protein n=1 Tax=Novosphingobium sp. TaxID=1874826 RepID=UPI0035656CA0
MSEPLRAVSLADLGADLGVAPAGFSRDRRFCKDLAAIPAPPPPPALVQEPEEDPDEPEPHDPVAEAWAEGYARGLGEAQEAAAQLMADEAMARSKIELSIAKLDAAMQADLKDRLRETVEALCEAAIAPAALDPDGLVRRVEVAAAMLARAQDERVIRLHPEDLALVAARLPEDWHFIPDATLTRGAVRVEGASGGVEDGPDQWRLAIAEALRQC